MAIPNKPSYSHGSQGTEPSSARDYANGDPLDADNFDYFVDTPFSKIKALIDALYALDSDDDGVVDAADGASTYSEDGTTRVTHPTDVNFTGHLNVTDDNDGTVTIDTAALSEEEVEDTAAALISGGTGISVTYDDGSDTLTIDGHTRYADSEAISAINNDADHGSTAQHDYFSGSHNDLSDVAKQDHHGEPFSYETGHASWNDGLSNEEVHRIALQSGETLDIERIEFRQKGGGSSTNASIDVYDVGATSAIGSVNLGSTAKDVGTSNSGNTVIIRLTNSIGSVVEASVRVTGYINGA